MGNIAYRSGKKISWDAAQNKFTDNAVQKEYYVKQYHNGYVLPKM
jgi:hypothetical protein